MKNKKTGKFYLKRVKIASLNRINGGNKPITETCNTFDECDTHHTFQVTCTTTTVDPPQDGLSDTGKGKG